MKVWNDKGTVHRNLQKWIEAQSPPRSFHERWRREARCCQRRVPLPRPILPVKITGRRFCNVRVGPIPHIVCTDCLSRDHSRQIQEVARSNKISYTSTSGAHKLSYAHPRELPPYQASGYLNHNLRCVSVQHNRADTPLLRYARDSHIQLLTLHTIFPIPQPPTSHRVNLRFSPYTCFDLLQSLSLETSNNTCHHSTLLYPKQAMIDRATD